MENNRYPIPQLMALLPGQELLPENLHRAEENIQRSLFVTSLGRAQNAEEARLFIDAIRLEYADATHNCWAFVAGPPGDTRIVGYSDDGEPHGTAGRPMLTQLLHCQVGEIVAVVTRYFGGIKLGTGGLVRAYQGSVKMALGTLPVVEKIIPAYARIVLDYCHIPMARRILPQYEAQIIAEELSQDATWTLSFPQEHKAGLLFQLAEITQGALLVEEITFEESLKA